MSMIVPNVLKMSLKQFNEYLNSWKYGVIINDKIITDPRKIDCKKYKTIPIDIIEKYHVGVCYDFVNYQHYIFNKKNINHESYLFLGRKNNGEYITHTFNIIKRKSGDLYFESSWMKHQGIEKVKDGWRSVAEYLCAEYEVYKFDVYKYNPDGLDCNLSGSQFINKASQKLIFSTENTPKSKNYFKLKINFKKKKQKFNILDIRENDILNIPSVKDNENIYNDLKYKLSVKCKQGEIALDKNGSFAGYIIVSRKEDNIIGPLWIEEQYRGYGLSNILMKDAVEKWDGNYLGVYADNQVAIQLYKKFGFKINSAKIYKDGTVVYFMNRK